MYNVRPKTHGALPHVVSNGKFTTYHFRAVGKLATVPSTGYTGADMGKAYQFPVGITAPMPTVWIPELGGGFDSTEIGNWCKSRGFPMPNLTAIGVGGATNSYTGDPQSADVEVELDICNVIGAISYMFGSKPANIVVVFAPNSESGMPEAYQYILANAKPGDTCSLSWGGPEDTYSSSDIATMESLLQQLATKGVTCTFASGDNGPDDGESKPVTDYPGCSAWGVDCGATTIVLNSDGSLYSQVPWNSGGGASGGGYSKIIYRPAWQNGLINSGEFRSEPDCVANGDPATGWDTPFGVIGGTSAVAPFMAAYFAGVNALLMAAGKAPLGLPNALMYANEAGCFTDIVTGSIGNGFPATVGYDTASGLGSILGTAFATVAAGGAPIPVPPALPPTPPSGITLAQVITIISAELTKLESLNTGYAFVHKATFIAQVGAAIETYVTSQLGGSAAQRAINWGPIEAQLPTIINALLPIIINIIQSQQGQAQPAFGPGRPIFPGRPIIEGPIVGGVGAPVSNYRQILIPSGMGASLDGQQL